MSSTSEAKVISSFEPASIVVDSPKAEQNAIPLVVKILFTTFFLMHGYYNCSHGGWQTYIWYCNTALICALLGMWLENSLLVGMATISTLIPLSLWTIDLLSPLLLGKRYLFISDYMDDSSVPMMVRVMSSYHVWLPWFSLWMVWRLGYHRKAWMAQIILAAVVFAISYAVSVREGGPFDPVNVNWVYGLTPTKPHRHLSDGQYVIAQVVLLTIAFYFPTHLLLRYTIGRKSRPAAKMSQP